MAKILVIDDDERFLDIVQTFLTDNGFEVITATDGPKGFEMAKSEHPGLIILDVLMPEVDGFTILIEIRKDDTIKDIPIVLCTGAQSDYFDDIPEGGPYAYITKPFQMPVLMEKINELLK